MNHDTLFNRRLQFTRGAVRSKRMRLERATLSGWNADTSRTIDAYVYVEEALANLEAIETAGTVAMHATAPAPCPAAQLFPRPQLVPRGMSAYRSRVSVAQRLALHDAHGFESVGSIIPRTLQMIDEAALAHRRAVS